MTWLVTGGAGYIGSHIVAALRASGDPELAPVVLDDLSAGYRSFVPAGVPFANVNILDQTKVEATILNHGITGVIHVAGFKYAGVSVERPLHTYRVNVEGTRILLDAMLRQGVDRIVFSSSAAVYGTPDVDLVTEQTPTHPESPYGESKLIGEWLLADVARQEERAGRHFRHTSLRYFNVVGSGSDARYDTSPHNLFPLVFDTLRKGGTPRINGDDYATADGTCVRDYVHVADVALAHVEAARILTAGDPLAPLYNLGSGVGSSVRQIMDAIRAATGHDFVPEIAPRRPGDPARIVASGALATRDLNWRMRHTVDDMVSSAWSARVAAGDTYPQHTSQ